MSKDGKKEAADPGGQVEYDQCPFCDALLVHEIYRWADRDTKLEKHIKEVHKKVKVRRGNNYKWMDAADVQRLIIKAKAEEQK